MSDFHFDLVLSDSAAWGVASYICCICLWSLFVGFLYHFSAGYCETVGW
jgi:hypothetical protein